VHAISEGYAEVAKTKPRFGVKQVDRFLSNTAIDVARLTPSWAKFVVGARKEIVVALDWTDFEKDDHTTLCAYLVTSHGRATALTWKTVKKSSLVGRLRIRAHRANVLPRRDAEHHLLDGARRERVGLGELLPRLELHLATIDAVQTRSANAHALTAERELAVRVARPPRRAPRLVCVSRATELRPLFLEHRSKHGHARAHDRVMQRGSGIDHGSERELGRRLLAARRLPGSVLHRRFLSGKHLDFRRGRWNRHLQISTEPGTTPKHPRKTSLATELAYFRKHKKRMRYMELQSKGLMIGSGVVEAACKTLVTQRLK
jgi:hypothetical protein